MKPDRLFESRLISRSKGFAVEEREALLGKVLGVVNANETRKGPAPRFLRPAIAGAVSLVLFAAIAIPMFIASSRREPAFRPKGSKGDRPALQVECLGDSDGTRCKRGDKLAFSVRPPKGRPYLFAFAVREADGVILWYFPHSEKDYSVLATDRYDSGVLTQGIDIGPEHSPGRYELFDEFDEQPGAGGCLRVAPDE